MVKSHLKDCSKVCERARERRKSGFQMGPQVCFVNVLASTAATAATQAFMYACMLTKGKALSSLGISTPQLALTTPSTHLSHSLFKNIIISLYHASPPRIANEILGMSGFKIYTQF